LFTVDGNRLFSGMGDGSVKFWDAKTGELIKNFKGLKRKANSRVSGFINKIENQIIITSNVGDLWFFDAETGELKRELNGHAQYINYVNFLMMEKKSLHNLMIIQ
jgi:WD40 repeat protein